MRALVVIVLLAVLGGSGAGFYLFWQKIEKLEGEQAKARADINTIGSDYASAVKADRALDHLQGQINMIGNKVREINNDYAVGAKVDQFLNELRAAISKLQKDVVDLRKPPPTPPAPPPVPTHYVDLGFRKDLDTDIVLRYGGSSFADGLNRPTQLKPRSVLASEVTPLEDNPRFGTMSMNYAVLRSPEMTRTITLKTPLKITLVRSAATTNDWELNAAARDEIKKSLGLEK